MKALVYTDRKQLKYKQVPEPKVENGEILIKVEAVGICGSDIHAYLGHDERRPAPLILGHEVAGLIVEGKNSGQRVTVNPLISCGICSFCVKGRNNICPERQLISMPPRDGGFADYLTIPEKNTILLPQNIDVRHAALIEPLACSWHAVKVGQISLDIPIRDAKCLIIGGGAIGVGVNLALKATGAVNISMVDNNPLRYKSLSRQFGGTTEILLGVDKTVLYDFVIDAVGFADSRMEASRICRPGGVIAHIGLGDGVGGLDIRRMTLQEITFAGTYSFTSEDFKETAQAIFNSKMGDFGWIEERPLDEGAEAFLDILNGEVSSSKVLLRP
jgi:L-gulonate 5-dehydrogenase